MAPAIGVVASRLTALPVKDEQLSSIVFVLCSSAEAKTYLILELDPLGLPFLRGSKESNFAAFDQLILLAWLECCYIE